MRRLERHRRTVGAVIWGAGVMLALSAAMAQSLPKFAIEPLAEKKIDRLPAGPLDWRVETFPALAAAQAATGPTSFAVEADGRAWLLTLGRKSNATPGATSVTEIGPVPDIRAPEYLLRINRASGPPGAKTPQHTHPGSESFYVLGGQLTQKTPNGIVHIDPGQGMTGQAPGIAMQVSSSGTRDLSVLVMFVVDATKPFSSTERLSEPASLR